MNDEEKKIDYTLNNEINSDMVQKVTEELSSDKIDNSEAVNIIISQIENKITDETNEKTETSDIKVPQEFEKTEMSEENNKIVEPNNTEEKQQYKEAEETIEAEKTAETKQIQKETGERKDKNEKKEKKKHGALKKTFLSIAFGALAGLLAFTVLVGINHIKNHKEKDIFDSGVEDEFTEGKKNDVDGEGNLLADASSDDEVMMPVTTADYSAVAKAVMPSVVAINCNIAVQRYSIFGFSSGTVNKEASGTGFIIGQNDNEILIATNDHVVDGAKNISVTFTDGTMADATVKGNDSFYDLAVIAIDADDLEESTIKAIRVASLGNSDNVKVGSIAIAIGNSLGYGQSITIGYISAINREQKNENGTKLELIQTDTAINPGNSGGPLLNVYGEVIGINSSKNVGEAVEGMGYCIPISKAIPVINELMNRVELSENEVGYLGIQGKDISEAYAKSFDMPSGVYVYEVEEDSPAKEAGIFMGDIITSINGRAISSMDELRNVLSYIKAGTQVKLEVSTKNRGEYTSREVYVTLGKRPKK